MPVLGCIADDLAGAAEVAAVLAAAGLRCVITRDTDARVDDADALVVALDSRTAPAAIAVRDSLAALSWLRAAGCARIFFKYGAHFDSTDEGNIGAVCDALVAANGSFFALVCPAAPAAGVTVYQGHLFVGATPLHDTSLVRVLSRQTEGTVGLVPYATVARGSDAIRDAMTALREQGRRYAIIDAVDAAQMPVIAAAAATHPLITGAFGLAQGLAACLGATRPDPPAFITPASSPGRGAVLAAASTRTMLYQIGAARAHLPLLELDARAMPDAAATALAWAEQQWAKAPDLAPIITLTGAAEGAAAAIGAGLVARGARHLLVAGEAAASAVAAALGVRTLRAGMAIDEGVAWMVAEHAAGTPLLLALKSPEAGARHVLVKAFEMLREG